MCVRTELLSLLSAAILAISACGDGGKPVMSLEEYAKRDCAVEVESLQRIDALGQQAMNRLSQLSALAETVSSIAQLFSEVAAKTDELGDPPNGEGKGGASEAAEIMRSAATQVEQIAADIRSAKTSDEIVVKMTKFQQTLSNTGPMYAQFKAKYPTPELDKVEKEIPGCREGE